MIMAYLDPDGASASQRRPDLLQLPEELLLVILECLDAAGDLETLRALALACVKLERLAEPYIYQDVLITSGEQVLNLRNSLQAQPRRHDYIKRLAIRYRVENQTYIDALELNIPKMSRLQMLHLEAPCFNDGPYLGDSTRWNAPGKIDYNQLLEQTSVLRSLQDRRLTSLQSLTIHSHRDVPDQFALPTFCSIFHSATLRSLKLQCLDVDFDGSTLRYRAKCSTPLEQLTFEECNISASTLKDILACPRGLQLLSLGEREHHFASARPLADDPETFLDALSVQAASLTSLTHTCRPSRWPRIQPAAASPLEHTLPNVEYLSLGPYSILQLNVWHRRLNLQHLRHVHFRHCELAFLEDHRTDMAQPFFESWLPAAASDSNPEMIPSDFTDPDYDFDSAAFPKFPPVSDHQYIFEMQLADGRDFDGLHGSAFRFALCKALFPNAESRLFIAHVAHYLSLRKCRFVITAIAGVPFIPPYMYGEDTPQTVVLYDSINPHDFGLTTDALTQESGQSEDMGLLAL